MFTPLLDGQLGTDFMLFIKLILIFNLFALALNYCLILYLFILGRRILSQLIEKT